MIRFWRYFNWKHQEKRLFWLAFYWLCRAKFSIAKKSYDGFKPMLGKPVTPGNQPKVDPKAALPARIALNRAQKVLPFHCQCLVTAIAIQKLCAQLRLPTTLHLGVNKKDEQLNAHAWVCLGDKIIEGQNGETYTTVKVFNNGGVDHVA